MWHLDGYDPQENAPASQPAAAQLRQALTPPRVPAKEKRRSNPVLRVQLAVCALLLLLAYAGKTRQLPWFEPCRRQYQTIISEGMDFYGQKELVRFVSGAVQQVQEQAALWMDLETQTEQLTGMGGLFPQKEKKLPAGYSLESCVPGQPLSLPLQQFAVTSEYGWRSHPITGKTDFHTGIDLAAGEGTAIAAAMDGFVLSTGSSASYGNNVLLLHQDGVLTRYCHMQYVFVRRGESVLRGDSLGTVGHTGMATGPHLHFEILRDNIHYDPAEALGL